MGEQTTPGAGHVPAPGQGLARHAAELYHAAFTRHAAVNGYRVTHAWDRLGAVDQVLLVVAMAETLAGLGVERDRAEVIRLRAALDQEMKARESLTWEVGALTSALAIAEWDRAVAPYTLTEAGQAAAEAWPEP